MSISRARQELASALTEQDRLQTLYERSIATSTEQDAYAKLRDAARQVALCTTALRLAEQPNFGRTALRRR